MPVGYEVEAFVGGIGLEFDPVLERAEVVADVETSGGAHAGDDAVLGSGQVFASVKLGDSLQFTDWERKRKNGRADFTTEFTEVGAQRTQRRVKNGDGVALDRKSPPLQTKGGAPSRSFV